MKTQHFKQIEREDLISTIKSIAESNQLELATIQAVYTKNHLGKWSFLIGKCEVGVANEQANIIYSDHAFICKTLKEFELETFLKSLDDEGYIISNKVPPILCDEGNKIIWNEEIIPSYATKVKFPVRKYSSTITRNSYFNESVLLGFNVPFNESSSQFVKKFMSLSIYHGSSDGRNGEFSIEITDSRGKICVHDNKLSIEGTGNNLCLVGQTTDKNKIIINNNESVNFNEKDLNEAELWLLTEENEILDYHSKHETQYRLENLDEDSNRSEKLLRIIERGESQNSEFKVYILLSDSKNSKSEEIEKTVCALSNTTGGYLFIGVTDDGLIEGIDKKVCEEYQDDLHKCLNLYINAISKRIREALKYTDCFNIFYEKIGKNHIIVITVERTQKVNYYVNKRDAYIRRGASSFKMKSIEEREAEQSLFLE